MRNNNINNDNIINEKKIIKLSFTLEVMPFSKYEPNFILCKMHINIGRAHFNKKNVVISQKKCYQNMEKFKNKKCIRSLPKKKH